MHFGHFDDQNKEYVITRPDTPRSWCNYLGSTTYGAIITNHAGGYSFFHSSAQGRFTRFRLNTIPMDQPGRYFYIRDRESGDFWCSSWQPVGKPLDQYQLICRHGTAYTILESQYQKTRTETLYFVPLEKEFEFWLFKIQNIDTKTRFLSIFPFIEYASFWQVWMDWVNLQYTQHVLEMKVVDGIINHCINPFLPVVRGDFAKDPQSRHTFFAIVGVESVGFDTDREKFIGPYRGYGNPLVVEQGKCTNSIAVGDNGCGVFQIDIELKPEETQEFLVVMGIGQAEVEGKNAVNAFSDFQKVHQEFEKLKTHWHNLLEKFQVETPDKEFNSMMNVWGIYNSLITYTWSRSASLVYTGERDGLGYRDTVQDILGVLPIIPEEAQKRLELMITGQVSTGGAMPVVRQFSHCPGKEKPPKESEYRSDDCLWLFNTIPAYVKETGDISFYEKVLPYADQGEDTVFGHLRKAIEFSLNHSGKHGLPCGLSADWNDCVQLGQKGESVFVAFQLRYALKTYIEIAHLLDKKEEAIWAKSHLEKLDHALQRHAWDGKWFLRGIREDGTLFGSHSNKEGQIFLNPQTWAILSGYVQGKEAETLLQWVQKHLNTEYGLLICHPPYEKTDISVMKAALFNKGMKENASIFCHTQGWAVMANAILGNGSQAYHLFRAYMPSAFNDKAEIREVEPYVYCQYIHGPDSLRYGAGRIPWLTGSAAWSYFSATQYILGIKPEIEGLRIDPCIPGDWKKFSVHRIFRGKILHIVIENPKGVEKGVQKIILNGEMISGNLILEKLMKKENSICVLMGV